MERRVRSMNQWLCFPMLPVRLLLIVFVLSAHQLILLRNLFTETPQVDKWLMSILWRMCGIEMHFDSNIAKWLSALSNSLTSFVGDTDIADLSSVNDADDEVNDGDVADLSDAFMDEEEEEYDEPDGLPKLPVLLKDKGNNYAHVYSLERQLWRQTRRISELR